MLPSDPLGEKGQSRFKELCADAGLICNKSDRDIAGWDFIVDFDLDESSTTSLDRRKTPLSCHVQVKTIYDRTSSVRLPLKMAERLAKELKPSFICVFKVDEGFQFTAAYLMHMSGDHLGRILKRLRQAGAKASSTEIRKMTISFTPTEEEKVGVTGSALRDAIVRHIGSDLPAYSEKKRLALQSMGYDMRSAEGQFEIDAASLAAFQDMLIGLKGEVEIKKFDLTITRFGITLPEASSPTAKISLVASPLDTCAVVFRNSTSNETAIFEGDAFFAPNIPGIERRIHIKCQLFSIFITLSEGGSGVSIKFDPEGKLCQLDEWSSYWRMMRLIDSKTALVELKLLNQPNFAEIAIGEQLAFNPGASYVEARVGLCDDLEKLFKFAGVKHDFLFPFTSITTEHEVIKFLVEMIDGTDSTVFNGTIPATEEQSQSFQGDGLLAGKLVIESVVLAYYARIAIESTFAGGVCTITATNFQIRKARRVSDSEVDFQNFIDSAKKAESVEIVLTV